MSRGIITTEQRQKQAISRLTNENAKLRVRVVELEKENADLRQKLENVLLRMAELEEIIFGKKKKPKDDNRQDDFGASGGDLNNRGKRDKLSYQRPIPAVETITDTSEHKIDNCPDCGTPLTKKQIIIRYIEDIKLACLDGLGADGLNPRQKIKQVIEQRIDRGYCPKCHKWHSAIPLSSKVVRPGPKVKMFVAYAVNILRLSYEQTKNILVDLYDFPISDGEIANILERTAMKLNPELERIKVRILGSTSIHLDETGHQTGSEKNYSWVIASGDSEEAVFSIGKNRGKGNAVDLLDGYTGVRVTDCYPAYKNMPGDQQVCWAHIIRKFRDLSNNENLKEDKKSFAGEMYGEAAELYEKVKIINQTSFIKTERAKAVLPLKKEAGDIVKKILNRPEQSVKKLTDLAKQLLTYREQLFTCLTHESVAATNNKAERKLRHLVLKRKTSFGTKTKKGDDVLGTNLSVLLSLWWQDRKTFFLNFNRLVGT